jgi:hypothetical protein
MLAGIEYERVQDISAPGCITNSNSSVGIVTRLQLDDREVVFRVSAEYRVLRFSHIVQASFEAHAVYYLRVHTLSLYGKKFMV